MAGQDLDRLHRLLPQRRRLGEGIELLERCVSTNDEAKRRLGDGEALDGRLLVARVQEGGRGRRARDWWSGPKDANLALTLGLRQPGLPPEVFGLLGACALVETMERWLPRKCCVSLKWPNDVLVEGAKIAGFLGELPASGETMLLGLGVNLQAAPEAGIAPYPTTCLADAAGEAIDPTLFLGLWLVQFEKGLVHFLQRGPRRFEQRFLQLLQRWAPHGVRESRGGHAGRLRDFRLEKGLTWGTDEELQTRPMAWIHRLEALPSATVDC